MTVTVVPAPTVTLSANPTNLATKSNKPMGGWELIVASP